MTQTADAPRRREELSPAQTPKISEDFEAPLASGRELRVIDGATGQPLANAVVAFVSVSQFAPKRTVAPNEMLRNVLSEPDHIETGFFKNLGKRYRSDGNGRLFLPLEQGIVMGRWEQLWELKELPAGPEELITLALFPNTTVNLRLLDHSGNPVSDVEVALQHDPDIGSLHITTRVTEERTGMVTYAHLGRVIQAAKAGLFGAEARVGKYVVGFAVHQREVAHYEINPEVLPQDLVDVVLEPTGSITIQLTGDLELPFTERAYMDLLETGIDESGAVDNLVNWTIPTRQPSELGRTLYPRVALGLTFDATMSFEDGSSHYTVQAKGPTAPGEHIVIEIPLRTSYPILHLRLLGPSGSPLENESVKLTLQRLQAEDDKMTFNIQTNKLGQVRVHVKSSRLKKSGEPYRLTVSKGSEGSHMEQTVRISDFGFPGHIDMGDLLLIEAPVAVTGKVLGKDGSPLAGARVEAWRAADGNNGERFVRYRGTHDLSDDEGRFQVACFDADSHLRLLVGRSGYIPRLLAGIDPGTNDLEVQLDAAGSIAGHLLLPVQTPTDRFGVHMKSVSLEPRDHGRTLAISRGQLYPDGSFVFHSIIPGDYTLTVTGDGESLASLEKVLIRSGEQCPDPRLDGIELAKFKLYEFAFRASNGQRPEWGEALVQKARTDGVFREERYLECDGGILSFISMHESIDLQVDCEHYGSLELHGQSEGGDFVLIPWPTIEVQFSGHLPTPPKDMRWITSLAFSGGNSEWREEAQSEEPRAAGFRASYSVKTPGDWQLRVALAQTIEHDHRAFSDGLPQWTLKITDAPNQSFDVNLGEIDLERAVVGLRAKLAEQESQ